MRDRFREAYRRGTEADSAYSLATWGYKALDLAFPTVVGGSVIWAATYRDWIWNEYGMFGALFAGIVAAVLVSIVVLLSGYGMAAWRGPPKQIETEGKTLEIAKPVEPVAPKAAAKTHPHDVPKKLTVIDEQITPLIRDEGEIELHLRRGRQLLNDWKQSLGPERRRYLDELGDYQRASASLFDQLYKIQQANPHFEDIAALLDIGSSPYRINDTYAHGLSDFCAGISAFGDPHTKTLKPGSL